jgi:hypothetical protein
VTDQIAGLAAVGNELVDLVDFVDLERAVMQRVGERADVRHDLDVATLEAAERRGDPPTGPAHVDLDARLADSRADPITQRRGSGQLPKAANARDAPHVNIAVTRTTSLLRLRCASFMAVRAYRREAVHRQ